MSNILKLKTALAGFTDAYKEIIEATEAMGNTEMLSLVDESVNFTAMDIPLWNERLQRMLTKDREWEIEAAFSSAGYKIDYGLDKDPYVKKNGEEELVEYGDLDDELQDMIEEYGFIVEYIIHAPNRGD